jgi:hypothetical protein
MKPFVFYRISEAGSYYRYSYYNPGRFAGGVGFGVKKYF